MVSPHWLGQVELMESNEQESWPRLAVFRVVFHIGWSNPTAYLSRGFSRTFFYIESPNLHRVLL